MLRSLREIKGFDLRATDGEIGKVADFQFDDVDWTVRYMVAETGNWLLGRRVLISPVELGRPDWDNRRLPIALTQDQIERSPDVAAEAPVSRQKETELAMYYGWMPYWGQVGSPAMVFPAKYAGTQPAREDREQSGDPHLRSVKEVLGYHIRARDEKIGHVEDFLTDENWVIRYIVVDTRNWLPGRTVLVAPPWIQDVDWAESLVHVHLEAEEIRTAPEWDPDRPVSREYEQALHEHYGRPPYWEPEAGS